MYTVHSGKNPTTFKERSTKMQISLITYSVFVLGRAGEAAGKAQ